MALQLEWYSDAGDLQLLEFDAVVRETHEAASDVTDHAVETGAAITDHVRPQGDTLSLEAIVTNTPILVPGTAMDGATGGTRAATLDLGGGRSASVNVLQWSRAFDRARAVDVVLKALRDEPRRLTVRTALREVPDVVIQRYRVEREAETGNVLAVNLDLRVVRVATTQRVAVTATAQRRQQRPQNRGAQPTTPPDNRALDARLADTPTGRRLLDAAGLGSLHR